MKITKFVYTDLYQNAENELAHFRQLKTAKPLTFKVLSLCKGISLDVIHRIEYALVFIFLAFKICAKTTFIPLSLQLIVNFKKREQRVSLLIANHFKCFKKECTLALYLLASSIISPLTSTNPYTKSKVSWQYLKGNPNRHNYARAFALASEGARRNIGKAHLTLGCLYLYGDGLPANPIKAKEHFEAASKAGCRKANYWIGCLYDEGEGVVKDHNAAKRFYEMGKIHNCKQSFFALAHMHKFGREGMPAMPAKAFEEFKQLAEAGDPLAMFELADMYAKGIGCNRNIALMEIWGKKSAEAGHIPAGTFLGEHFLLKEPRDYTKAKFWLEWAALRGNPKAQCAFGDMHYLSLGMPQDYRKAFFWYKMAADAGYSPGQYLQAECYFHGKGVRQNLEEALRLAQLSNEGGVNKGAELASIIQELMADLT